MSQNILVGDIGSTKSTWWSNSEGNKEFHLTGYNPVVHEESVGQRMFEQLWHVTEGDLFHKVWYYGTGVLDPVSAGKVSAALKKYFPKATIEIESDLLGAAKASCGTEPGTFVILGTGSHAAVYDGTKIIRQASSLGYLLGDEGGGSDIGKELVKAYFYKQLPTLIADNVESMIQGNRSDFLQRLYHAPAPNQFLADFAKVAVQHQHDSWIQQMVQERFILFIRNHVLPLHPQGPIHEVGSIGTIFADLFRNVLEKNGLKAGDFIKDPARRLFEMHLQHE